MATNIEEKKSELQRAVADMLPDTTVTLGFLEHYVDLMGMLVSILAHKSEDSFSEDEKKLLGHLDAFLKYGSIDFKNIVNPMEAYKIPKAIEAKKHTRFVQKRYLQSQIKENIFGK